LKGSHQYRPRGLKTWQWQWSVTSQPLLIADTRLL